MKRLLLAVVLTLGSFITLPAFAWPEVDHMNMCGPATKVVRAYQGNSQGFAQRDRYIEQRGMAYYFRSNCPNTKAPVNAKAQKTGNIYQVKKHKRVIAKTKKASKGARVKKITKRLRGGYDEHADCLRVDRLNSYGSPVRVMRWR